jgi:cell division septum initiation protein DivIVA
MAKNQTSRGRPEFKDTVIGGIPKEWAEIREVEKEIEKVETKIQGFLKEVGK